MGRTTQEKCAAAIINSWLRPFRKADLVRECAVRALEAEGTCAELRARLVNHFKTAGVSLSVIAESLRAAEVTLTVARKSLDLTSDEEDMENDDETEVDISAEELTALGPADDVPMVTLPLDSKQPDDLGMNQESDSTPNTGGKQNDDQDLPRGEGTTGEMGKGNGASAGATDSSLKRFQLGVTVFQFFPR